MTASRDHTARIWELRTGKFLSFAHPCPVLAAQFSADGRLVATGASDGIGRIWDATDGRVLAQLLQPQGEINSIAFSPDGQRVATAAADQTIRVWDARSGLPLTDPLHTADKVWGVHFTSCGRWVVTKSGLMWELPPSAGPAPSWLPELAEAVAGKRFVNGSFTPVPADALLDIRHRLAARAQTNAYARWATWFLADPQTRTISPSARMTVAEYVEQKIAANTVDSLQEAVRLSPTNARARTQLATLSSKPN